MPKSSLYARACAAFTMLGWALVTPGAIDAAEARHQDPAPCAECIVLTASPEQSAILPDDLHGIEILVRPGDDPRALRTALERIRDRRGRAGLWIQLNDPRATDPEMAALVNRVVVDLSSHYEPSQELAFRLKTYLTELRSAATGQQVGFYAASEVVENLRQRGLGAYVDFVARDATTPPVFPIRAGAGSAPISMHPSDGRDPERWIITLVENHELARSFLLDLTRTAPILRQGLIPGGMVDIHCAGRPVPTFLDAQTLDTLAVVRECPETQLSVAPEIPDVIRLTMSDGSMVVKVSSPLGRFAQGVQVRAARQLSVREIIARHQAAAARQRREVSRLISTGRMTLTFEAPGFPAPMTITTDTVIYTEGNLVDIEQRDIRVNGIAFPGNKVPRLPLLEPERVGSLPLAISLTDVYRYSLDREDMVAGVKCFVVKFEPADRERSLFAGRAWISADDFGMVKVAAVQTRLRGPIVSSEQIDEFRLEYGSVWLLARSQVHQIYEGPGHRTPVQRLLTIDRHEINPTTFASRRQTAYTSPSIMLRDTAEGFRYLRRERTTSQEGTPAIAIADPAERIRTIAAGVIVDPNISRPLPFAGLSYVDFNLFGTGTQLNGFFGGSFGQLAVAVPSLRGTRWQLAARAFGIASSYNDRAFVEGREDYQANIAQRPAHVSAWLLRPLTSRMTARGGYEFDYTAYHRVDSTSTSFVVPAAQVSHAVRLGLESQWSGWSVSAWWVGGRRAGWRSWGEGGSDYDPRHRHYQRFGAGLTRAFVLSPRLVGRFEAAWMAGRDLDRFSRYSFGSFDNRLHGYPSALIRYDRGGVLRGAAAWAPGRRFRVDVFADTAYVHDPNFGRGSRNYTGIGTAVEIPAPLGTLLAVEWGYGFRGINADGRRGTQVIRISGYKMF